MSLAKQLLDSLFGEEKTFIKPRGAALEDSLFTETKAASKVKSEAPKITPEELVNRYGLLNEAGTTAEAAFKEYYAAASKLPGQGEILDIGGLSSPEEVLHILQDISKDEWQAMRREHIKTLRKQEALDSIKVNEDEYGGIKFEYKPSPQKFTELFQADKARVEKIKKQLEAGPSTHPTLFTSFDTATVDNAYARVRKQFHDIYSAFREDRKAYIEGPYRENVEIKVYSTDQGTDITIRNPIDFNHWLRAAEALSHDFDASAVRNMINDLDIPTEYAPYFDPFNAKTWNILERDYVPTILDMIERDGIDLRRIQDEGVGIDTIIKDATSTSPIQTQEADIKLLRAYNRVQAFRYGKSSITRKAIEDGLRRIFGIEDVKYYDGSVDAVLQTLDSLKAEYNRLKNTIYEPQAKFLLKAWDDVARGGKFTEMPTLRLLDTMSNVQAHRDAYFELQKFKDEAAAGRVYERDHPFDIASAYPAPTAKYGGRPDDPFFQFSLKSELSSRTDLIAGYEGQTQRLDPDWLALSGKGITDFDFGYMPGEAYKEDMQTISQAIEFMEDELYTIDTMLGTSYEVPSWDELITKELFHAGIDTSSGVVDYSEAALRLPDENARQMFSKYATEKIANTLVNFFPLSPDAPRVGSKTVKMPWEAQHLNVLRINSPGDLEALLDEVYALKQVSDRDVFKVSFDSDRDFMFKTGFKVKEGLNPSLRDTVYSTLLLVQDSITDVVKQLNTVDDPISRIYHNLMIGKYLNIGTALTTALQGGSKREVDAIMSSWSLAANSPEDLAKKVYVVAYENFSRVFGNELDTMTMEQAGKIASYGSPQAYAGVLEGFADLEKFAYAKQRISDAKRALYAKLNRPIPKEPTTQKQLPSVVIRRNKKGKVRKDVERTD